MSKYDFGYILEEGTTNKWAYEQIEEGARVLEIGPAVGNLTYHLTEFKKCTIDIVEIDEESGEKAKRYANKSLIGNIEGNLNDEAWFIALQSEKYDYIVALDVLEHLENPYRTLSHLKQLLSEKGKIILSIPNIAHNAVIMELFENNFEYSDVGLLDSTHIHFFTYNSILEMIEECRLNIFKSDSIKKAVSDTEFECDYSSLPTQVEYFLRTRKYSDVYQFLLILQEDKCVKEDLLKEGILPDSYYETKVLINGLSENQSVFKGQLDKIEIELDLREYHDVQSIRFIPVEKACIISNLHVNVMEEGGINKRIYPNWTTGIKLDDFSYVLSNENHEINYLLDGACYKLIIKCECMLIDEDVYDVFSLANEICNIERKGRNEIYDKFEETKSQYVGLQEILRLREKDISEIKTELENKIAMNTSLSIELENKTAINTDLSIELENQNAKVEELDSRNQALQVKYSDMYDQLSADIAEKDNSITELTNQLNSVKADLQFIAKRKDDLEWEINNIKTTKWYRWINKILSWVKR